MLIILDGPDGAGKSSLAEALKTKIDHSALRSTLVRHCGPIRTSATKEYIYDLDWYQAGSGMSIVYDRHYMGELIYGPIYRGQSQIDNPILSRIERNLNEKGCLLVHITGSLGVLAMRNRETEEAFLLEKDLPLVVDRYTTLMEFSRIKHKMTIDCVGVTNNIDEIIKRAQAAEREAVSDNE